MTQSRLLLNILVKSAASYLRAAGCRVVKHCSLCTAEYIQAQGSRFVTLPDSNTEGGHSCSAVEIRAVWCHSQRPLLLMFAVCGVEAMSAARCSAQQHQYYLPKVQLRAFGC